jgi:hypothetical protein
MKGQLIRITPSKAFVALLFKLGEKTYGLTYTGEQYRNYPVWSQFRIGDWVDGLKWKDEKKRIIDADSPVHLA